MALLFVPIFLGLMYVVLLRPQQQRLRSQRQLVASLDVGDEIITAGGIIGQIVALTDDRASIQVADGVVIDFLRAAVSRRAEDPRTAQGPTRRARFGAGGPRQVRPGPDGPDDGTDEDEVAPGDTGDRPDDGTH